MSLHPQDSDSVADTLDSWEHDQDNSEWTTPNRAMQFEHELRFLADLTRRAICLEWNMLLGVLLQDVTVFTDTIDYLKGLDTREVTLPDSIWVWLLEGITSLSEWAAKTRWAGQ